MTSGIHRSTTTVRSMAGSSWRDIWPKTGMVQKPCDQLIDSNKQGDRYGAFSDHHCDRRLPLGADIVAHRGVDRALSGTIAIGKAAT